VERAPFHRAGVVVLELGGGVALAQGLPVLTGLLRIAKREACHVSDDLGDGAGWDGPRRERKRRRREIVRLVTVSRGDGDVRIFLILAALADLRDGAPEDLGQRLIPVGGAQRELGELGYAVLALHELIGGGL